MSTNHRIKPKRMEFEFDGQRVVLEHVGVQPGFSDIPSLALWTIFFPGHPFHGSTIATRAKTLDDLTAYLAEKLS